jgi:hypothetical protein
VKSGLSVKVTAKDNSAAVLKAMNQLTKSRALVGVTQQKSSRKGEPVNNAELAYIHTNGSPLQHIPARPIIEPAIEAPDNKLAITQEMQGAAGAALDGKQQESKQFMKRAGLTAQNRVRSWFTDSRNNWAPNAPSTIARKGSDKPLIDTGSLRQAMSYAVEIDGTRE